MTTQGYAVIHSERGRGLQLNVGASSTEAEWLLFLHADTTLPHGFWDHAREAIGKVCIAVL
eukprot:scaffold1500_cov398-Prasinococcus_capsulatus_cf.AAC.3